MTGAYLLDNVLRVGQMKALRKLCLDSKLATAEKVATMTDAGVCNEIAKEFDFVATADNGDRILLVRKENLGKLWELLIPIDR